MDGQLLNSSNGVPNNPLARWLANDSFRPHPPDVAVYRYKMNVAIAPPVVGFVLALGLSALVASAGTQVVAYLLVPAFMWATVVAGWLFAVTTAVRVRADCLVLDNLLVRHVIPWERFAGMFVENGVGMFARLEDGTEIKSAAYGRSLGDATQGYRHMRETLERVRADCQQVRTGRTGVDPAPPYRRMVNVPWLPLAGALVFLEAFAWISFAVHAA